jgi:SAM-dependent methyltransferase
MQQNCGVDASAEQLLRDALCIPFQGWDFSVLGSRLVVEPPPWSFEHLVDQTASNSASMLDLGTGGGEWLSARYHPATTVATESWKPNVPIAAARLRPQQVPVVQDEGAVDNVRQRPGYEHGRLPFRGGAFELVVSRHEAFVASEVRRVLRPGGIFLTQQANSGTDEFHRLLGMEPPHPPEFDLGAASTQLEAAGFQIDVAQSGEATTVFADIGALAWYLTNVRWAVPGFSIDKHRAALLGLYGAPIRVTSARFLLQCRARARDGPIIAD